MGSIIPYITQPTRVFSLLTCFMIGPTVDGSEIRRAPVEFGGLSHCSQGDSYIPGGAGFHRSTVLGGVKSNTLLNIILRNLKHTS